MPKSPYNNYVLAVLTLTYTLSQVDQTLIGVVLQPIKDDLNLSDSQLGLVTGIAFGLFYATLGLPVGRWADRGNRSTIAAIAIGLWGVTVMSCFFVTNFTQLVFARMAAAVGASACMPPTYSLVGDYFPENAERTRAMTIYTLANPLSGLVGYVLGGWLNQLVGWRIAFLAIGIPGLALAAMIRWTIADKRRYGRLVPPVKWRSGMWEIVRSMWRQKSSRNLSIGIILLFTTGWGLNPWYATFMIRSHGAETAELGMWLGIIFGLSSIGVLLGGYVASRWFPDNERGQMYLVTVMVAMSVPFVIAFLLLPEKHQALIALALFAMVANSFFGPAFALLQRLVPAQARATQVAIVMLFANLIGMGIGAQMVGVLSDFWKPTLRSDSLRYAMIAVSLVSLWSAYHFWRVGHTVKKDLLSLEDDLKDSPSSLSIVVTSDEGAIELAANRLKIGTHKSLPRTIAGVHGGPINRS